MEAADRLTRIVVSTTEGMESSRAPGLGRTLREAAALAYAGTAAACRADDAVRALRGVAATDLSLQRLGVWLDLARRFGDLPMDAALELLEAQSRLRVVLSAVSDRWRRGAHRGGPGGCAWSSLDLGPGTGVGALRKVPRVGAGSRSLDVNNEMRYAARSEGEGRVPAPNRNGRPS